VRTLSFQDLGQPATDAAAGCEDEDPIAALDGVSLRDESEGCEALEDGSAGVFGFDLAAFSTIVNRDHEGKKIGESYPFRNLQNLLTRRRAKLRITLRAQPHHSIIHR